MNYGNIWLCPRLPGGIMSFILLAAQLSGIPKLGQR